MLPCFTSERRESRDINCGIAKLEASKSNIMINRRRHLLARPPEYLRYVQYDLSFRGDLLEIPDAIRGDAPWRNPGGTPFIGRNRMATHERQAAGRAAMSEAGRFQRLSRCSIKGSVICPRSLMPNVGRCQFIPDQT